MILQHKTFPKFVLTQSHVKLAFLSRKGQSMGPRMECCIDLQQRGLKALLDSNTPIRLLHQLFYTSRAVDARGGAYERMTGSL